MDIVNTSRAVIVSSINLYLYCGILIYMRGRVSKGDAEREREKQRDKRVKEKPKNTKSRDKKNAVMKHNKKLIIS